MAQGNVISAPRRHPLRPFSFPMLDIVATDDGVVGRGVADQTYNEARREYAN